MSRRFFTSDLHFYGTCMIQEHLRPFKSVERMNESILRNINQRCGDDDILISAGDLFQYGNDRKYGGEKTNPKDIVSMINPLFVNIRGNHDDHNKVKSVCDSMRTTLGKKYQSVSISHYPSTNPMARGTFRKGDVHLHGHVHSGPIFTIDAKNKVLNVNVCCDLWRFNPISEDELICAIDRFMREEPRRRAMGIS